MFAAILVPVDGSNDSWSALAQAIEIAQGQPCVIHVLFVADARLIDASFWNTLPTDDPVPDVDPALVKLALDVGKQLSNQGQSVLDHAEERCREHGVSCQTEYAEGIVSQIILDRAKIVDLVVMGRRGTGSKWAGPLLGSTFEAIIRHSPVPVLAAQSEAHPIRNILVAYDGSDRSLDALQLAAELVQAKKASLTFLTVDDSRHKREKAYAEGIAFLHEHELQAEELFVSGHPVEQILEVAREKKTDLIVIGAYGHQRYLEVFYGNTADGVIRGAICPVFICR